MKKNDLYLIRCEELMSCRNKNTQDVLQAAEVQEKAFTLSANQNVPLFYAFNSKNALQMKKMHFLCWLKQNEEILKSLDFLSHPLSLNWFVTYLTYVVHNFLIVDIFGFKQICDAPWNKCLDLCSVALRMYFLAFLHCFDLTFA